MKTRKNQTLRRGATVDGDGVGEILQVADFKEESSGPRNFAAGRPDTQDPGLTVIRTAIVDGRIVFVKQPRVVARTDVGKQLQQAKACGLYVAPVNFSDIRLDIREHSANSGLIEASHDPTTDIV